MRRFLCFVFFLLAFGPMHAFAYERCTGEINPSILPRVFSNAIDQCLRAHHVPLDWNHKSTKVNCRRVPGADFVQCKASFETLARHKIRFVDFMNNVEWFNVYGERYEELGPKCFVRSNPFVFVDAKTGNLVLGPRKICTVPVQNQ